MDPPPVSEETKDPVRLLCIPNELLLLVASHFNHSRDLYSFFLTNRRIAFLLTPLLHRFAAEDRRGLNALQWAAYRGHTGLAKLLIDKGFDVNHCCARSGWRSNWAPLLYAIRSGKSALVQLLLDNGADIETLDHSNNTPVHIAVYCMTNAKELNFDAAETVERREFRIRAVEMPAVLQMLLSKQPGLSVFNYFGHTALHEAVRRCTHGTTASLELLHGCGVPINHAAGDATTPLHTAVYCGGLVTVEYLLRHGASVSVKNKQGHTALDIATRRRNAAIVALLEQNMVVGLGHGDEGGSG